MKKIAILIAVVIVLGVGCIKSQTNLQTTQEISIYTKKNDGCIGKFIFPKTGDKLILGQKINIVWLMPKKIDTYYSIIGINLINNSDQKLGNIIAWNWVKYIPTTSAEWDVKKIYDSELQQNSSIILQPGKYRLEFIYDIADYSHTDADLGDCARKGIFNSDYFEIKN